ncbi:MAG: GWxTD domain-containing protein [Balneolaceae bacterium]
MYKIIILVAGFLLLTFFDSDAQRRTTLYESLLQRTEQPSSYVDHIVLPSEDSTAQFSVIFRLDYDLISFLRVRPDMQLPSPDIEYFAPVRMGLEIFDGSIPTSRRSANATSILRDSWQDTIWVNTFEETKSRFNHVEAFIPGHLAAGDYHYELQLARGGSVRESSSNRRNLSIPEMSAADSVDFILLNELTVKDEHLSASLLNYGSNVLYGQDYFLLIRLPVNDSEDELESDPQFTFEIRKLAPGNRNKIDEEIRYSVEITNDKMVHITDAVWRKSEDGIIFDAELNNKGALYAYVSIPNQNFENSRYQLRLLKNGQEEPLGFRNVSSQWLDMPISLYNLNVAIDMMKFIVSEDEIKRLQSGSTAEKEQKFRDFWESRDPTPDTEFNELMNEYYKRIDFAHINYTTVTNPGYETDQGKAYILYGPPDNIERRLPTNAPTREIWVYPNRTLIFEATSGFGDFRLVTES